MSILSLIRALLRGSDSEHAKLQRIEAKEDEILARLGEQKDILQQILDALTQETPPMGESAAEPEIEVTVQPE